MILWQSLKKAKLAGNDVWLGFNVSGSDLPSYASIASKLGIKRVVFGVNTMLDPSIDGDVYKTATQLLLDAGVAYTIVKYGSVKKSKESKVPYRIVRGELPLPNERSQLSSDDLYRVLLNKLKCPPQSLFTGYKRRFLWRLSTCRRLSIKFMVLAVAVKLIRRFLST